MMTAIATPMNIVLFSDNAFKRKLSKLALQSQGSIVVETGSLTQTRQAAMDEIGIDDCSIVVISLRDVEGEGLLSAQALREHFEAARPNTRQPVIALTIEQRNDAIRQRAADAGVDFTLIEPVDWSTLIARVAEREAAFAREAPTDSGALELTQPITAETDREESLDQSFKDAEAATMLRNARDAAEESEEGLSPHRFVWRPVDDAFFCGAAAAEALGFKQDQIPSTLSEWLAHCVAPRSEIVKAALDAALRDTGETMVMGACQKDDGPRAYFGLFAERRYDSKSRAVLTGSAHVTAAWSRENARDPLTGLYSIEGLRPPMTEILNRAIGERRRCAAYAVEITDFYEVDETYGIPVGDQVLLELAERAAQTLRSGDVIARVNRASFIIVQPEVKSLDDVRGLGARVTNALSAPVDIHGAKNSFGVAVGAAIGPDHADTAIGLSTAAETALREAVRKGTPGLNLYGAFSSTPARERGTLRREIQAAVMNGEFELHYLPAIDASGAVVCLEALLRLRRGDSWVAPDEVVDIAEQTGDVRSFVRRFFDFAAQDLALWRHSLGSTPKLAVNLTGAALSEGGALEEAGRALAAIGEEVDVLRFETTDKRLERRRAQAVISLAQAQEAGVEIALDDFGTRASAIESIASFPFNRIKIARALVGQDRARGGPDLFAAATALGRDLGLKMTANGVADSSLRMVAFQMGCDEAQGYGVSPPARVSDLVGWFSKARSTG